MPGLVRERPRACHHDRKDDDRPVDEASEPFPHRRAAETGDGPGLAIVGHGRVPGLDRLGVGRASSGLAITLIGHGTAGMAGRSEGTLVAAPQPLIVVGALAGFAPFIGDEHVAGRVRARASHRHDPPGDDAWSRCSGDPSRDRRSQGEADSPG